MKKSRRIKVGGVTYKYFVDNGAVDEDGRKYTRVLLYDPSGAQHWWNGPPENIGNREVKQAINEGKFYNYSGRLFVEK